MCFLSVLYVIVLCLIPFGCEENIAASVIRMILDSMFIPLNNPAILIVLDNQRTIPLAYGLMWSVGFVCFFGMELIATFLSYYNIEWILYTIIVILISLYTISIFLVTIDDFRGKQKITASGQAIRNRTKSRLEFYYDNVAEPINRLASENDISNSIWCCD